MDNSLPSQFDLIVVGTGLIESTVSAAASRIGKNVLHIDDKDFYGGIWASFNLDSIQMLINNQDKLSIPSESECDDNSSPIGNNYFNLKDVTQQWYIPENEHPEKEIIGETTPDILEPATNTAVTEVCWTQEKLLGMSRKFNIDLAPKLQFARGDFVELLISSNIARYSEYRSVSRILTFLNGELDVVPCSRSDIFSNSKVSVIDKRLLMKLLSTCMDGDDKEFAEYENKTLKTFLVDRKLSPAIVHYILYAIAMSDDETSCKHGITRIKRFLGSLGRFGKTPFLYSMYGSGETPQAFCRMSAVFGGIYALNQPLKSFSFDTENKFQGIVCGEQKIFAKHLVTGFEKAPSKYFNNIDIPYISRAVFIIDGSVLKSAQEQLSLILFPSEDGKDICYIIEAGSLSGCCPKDLYIIYMYMRQVKCPQADLKYFAEKLFSFHEKSDSKPNVLYSFYYSAPDTNSLRIDKDEEHVFLCPGPDMDLDYDDSMKKAKEIFQKLYPNEEMLPRAPDPEEIIIGDEPALEDDVMEKE